ncbi:elongator complex protein 3 [Clostridium cylindrosporum]|uniref:Radical SAM domain protein n=1 Tax=Clostridium cylindrosporum DSM 605 TaxID=1121307 RepID=A0A0J8DAZ1_CLOCY|nr:radical SAM protein [Clostridium cylindrosporum]KMT21479.1 radical SAM domain protein [Clostridium cylindrosporum DSM 605]
MNKYYIIPIFVPHKGCPHDCIFCNQKKITGSEKDITSNDVESIIELHLSTISNENAYIEVSFFGGSFTGIPIDMQKELLEVAYTYLKKGLIHNIRLSTRPDYINKDILNHLQNYNVGVIELGVQSLDEDVLKIAERGHSIEDVYYASKVIKEYGFTLGLQMMVGLPGDTLEKDILTAQKIVSLSPDFVRIYPALTIKNTQMEHMYFENKYVPLSIEEATNVCKILYMIFRKADIPIIRLGLQTTEQINTGKDIVAGPFHPAFRELVESSILNDMISYAIKNYYSDCESLDIYISPRNISKLYADKKRIFNNNISKDSIKKIKIRQKDIGDDLVLIFDNGTKQRKMSINNYIKCISERRNYSYFKEI